MISKISKVLINWHSLRKNEGITNSSVNYLSSNTLQPLPSKSLKVAILGAAGLTGQPLALLLKQSPIFDEIALYDKNPVCGIGTELGHVDTKCMISAYQGEQTLPEAIKDAKIIIILAKLLSNRALTAEETFSGNAPIICELGNAIAKHASQAFIAIVTPPINSTVPMLSKILQHSGCYDRNKVFGLVTIDCMRANTLVAKCAGLEPEGVVVPVVGGQSVSTIVPILSQTFPCIHMEKDEVENLTNAIKYAHTDVVTASKGQSPFLSIAYSVARFVISLGKAYIGEPDIIEITFVRSDVLTEVKFLASPVIIGRSGIERNLGLPSMNRYELCLIAAACEQLKKDIELGESFVNEETCCKPDCIPIGDEDKKILDAAQEKGKCMPLQIKRSDCQKQRDIRKQLYGEEKIHEKKNKQKEHLFIKNKYLI